MSDKDPGQKIDKHFPDKKVVGTFPAANDMTVGDDTEAEKLFFSHLSSSRPLFLGPKHSWKTIQMRNKNSVGDDRGHI